MNTHDIELPPLPKSGWALNHENAFTANDMKAYARAAIEADRKRRGEPVAWRWSESNGERWFAWTTDWSHHDRAVEMGCLIEYAAPQPAAPVVKDSLTVAEPVNVSKSSAQVDKSAERVDPVKVPSEDGGET